jgi:hypothetical protein
MHLKSRAGEIICASGPPAQQQLPVLGFLADHLEGAALVLMCVFLSMFVHNQLF